jgi:opacity protein-like surface antigen
MASPPVCSASRSRRWTTSATIGSDASSTVFDANRAALLTDVVLAVGRRKVAMATMTKRRDQASRWMTMATAVAVAVSAAVAMAEDTMPTQAPMSPYGSTGYNWTGFYVGGHATDSFGRATSTLSDPELLVSKNAFSNVFGGVQAGYNYVWPSRLILGAEADITFPNFLEDGTIFKRATSQSTTVTDQIDDIATLRARFGYAFDHWLIYGTGGIAWSQFRFGETPGVVIYEDKVLGTRTGWALGLGTESPSRRTGQRVSNIFTTGLAVPPASFPLATLINPPSTFSHCDWGSTTSSMRLAPTQRFPQTALRGRLPTMPGISTVRSPSSTKATPHFTRLTKERTAFKGQVNGRIPRAQRHSSASAHGVAPRYTSIRKLRRGWVSARPDAAFRRGAHLRAADVRPWRRPGDDRRRPQSTARPAGYLSHHRDRR